MSVEAALAAGNRLVSDTGLAALERFFGNPARALVAITAAVCLMKALLAWSTPGFYSGDDVEIHEMSIGLLLGRDWPVWNLRSAFFPILFIYPAQRAAYALGLSDPGALVLAGRLVVAVLSTAVIPLTWIVARRIAPEDRRVAIFAVIIIGVNKLQMSFGSSELPRPVSTVFVLAAFLAMRHRHLAAAAAGGLLLGAAAAFRFSELSFLPAALLAIPRDRFLARAAVLVLTAVLTLAAITGIADALYWGHPFSSLASAIDYTLVRRLSSRGYGPPWEYLSLIPSWSTPLMVALAAAGSSRRHPETWWLWLTVAILSVLPHKESRYLIPVTPFLSLAAARGLVRAIGWLRRDDLVVGWRRWTRELFAPALALSLLHDVGGWRLARSNEAVRLAKYVGDFPGTGVAAQDSWRLGGRPYLWTMEAMIDFDPELLTSADALRATLAPVRWVALRTRTARTTGDPALQSAGFGRVTGWHGEDYVLYERVK